MTRAPLPGWPEIDQLLAYDPSTGIFRWKVDRYRQRIAGEVAGSNDGRGYIKICVMKRQIGAHRLAWFLTHRVWPHGVIDHINGDKGDNRLANLRDVSVSANQQNRRKATSNTGVLGVHRNVAHKRYEVKIVIDGVRHRFPTYRTLSEAEAVYLDAKRRLHPAAVILPPREGTP